MASFRERGDGWEYRIKYKDPATGKKREKSKGGFRTKKEAQLAADEMRRKLELGIDINKEDMLLKDYFQYWFDNYKKGTVSRGTEKTFMQAINIITKHLGYVQMKDLDRGKYQRFINKIAPSFAKSTLQRHNSRWSEAFEEAVMLDIIQKNPAYKVKYPTTTKPIKNKKKNVELEEAKQLMQAMEEDWSRQYQHYKYITYLLIGTGARIGEVTALHLNDVDFKNKIIHINKTFIREDRVWKIKNTTKTGESGERTIGLDDFTLSKMKEWRKIRNEIILRHGLKDVPYFFINEIGDFIKTVNYGDMLRSICKRHKIRHITPHMFRHTHETIMWESGVVDLNFIGARLGDKDKTILLNTYGHLSKISEQTNMDKINQFMERWASGGQGILDKIDKA
ncbi:tyrosine-type recombinase/integrase [Bacillus smithii]|uniref:tyrosine-type recombinase/integrase n=1 Tax=Bacillus smithii TaxID=1479 RepID=UPI003D22C567